jgi:hypothetical protein
MSEAFNVNTKKMNMKHIIKMIEQGHDYQIPLTDGTVDFEKSVVSRDYYYGFMHAIIAFLAWGKDCPENADIGEYLMCKWLKKSDTK